MLRNVPLVEAFYAYCPGFDFNAERPQFGKVIVGTQAEINRELKLPFSERMPCWNAVCASGYGGPAAPEHRLAVMFANFIALILRDKIDPAVAHEAFLFIPEYRRHLATDVPGMGAYDH